MISGTLRLDSCQRIHSLLAAQYAQTLVDAGANVLCGGINYSLAPDRETTQKSGKTPDEGLVLVQEQPDLMDARNN